MAYEIWQSELYDTYEEALLEGQDAQSAMAVDWKVGPVYVFEKALEGGLVAFQSSFAFVEPGGELPGEAPRWPTILLIGGAFFGTVLGIGAAIVGSRKR